MLRIGYLPSDFHPMVCACSETRLISARLPERCVGSPASPRRCGSTAWRSARPAPLRSCSPQCPGALGSTRSDRDLAWRLCSEDALRFATQLDTLADPALLAGSQMLECGIEDEIPVKASRGGYTEDFLLRPAG